jgi:hypothetical protein
MGFFGDLGNDLTTVVTAGQCNTSGCGGSHRDTALGNTLVNTTTLGQCDGSGCGSGHTGTWAPITGATGLAGALLGGGQANPQQQQQLLQLFQMGLLFVGGLIGLSLLFDLL